MRIRLWFLLPLAVVLLGTVLLILLAISRHTEGDLDRDTKKAINLAEHLYLEEINSAASLLGAAMAVLATDQVLPQALARGDRRQLLQRAAPIFNDLRKQYGITHFYFSDSNRINILRVHQPTRFGDTIDRETTLQAQRSNQTSYGVELGPLGTFTFRLVTPWFATDGHLVGFVELGMEIDQLLRTLQHVGDVKTFVLINKQFLDRKEWEASMRSLGRLPDWDRYPDVVMNNQAIEDMPRELTLDLQESLLTEQKVMIPMMMGTSVYQAVFLPFKDTAGRNVGRMVMVLDISAQLNEVNKLMRESVLVSGVACVSLFGFFYWLLGVVGQRLDRDQQRLLEMAEHDGLTGLYNHRLYYLKLDEEFMRRNRTKLPISLLLLDIDHFKQVNDRYGHLTGDIVLTTLCELVMRSCRAMDIACRYGGEEITVILPETDTESAMVIAERLRKTVAAHHFDLGDRKDGHITVSIGVSTASELILSAKELTETADHALYLAKEQGRNRVDCIK